MHIHNISAEATFITQTCNTEHKVTNTTHTQLGKEEIIDKFENMPSYWFLLESYERIDSIHVEKYSGSCDVAVVLTFEKVLIIGRYIFCCILNFVVGENPTFIKLTPSAVLSPDVITQDECIRKQIQKYYSSNH